MSNAVDLRKLLEGWPYDPEHDARIILVGEGRSVLQVRTPLGIEQYELQGRPDGARPHGMESALEYQLRRLEEERAAGRGDRFQLTPQHCAELFNEGMLFYLRYVRLFQLKDWARTVRDTDRNLRAFDFIRRYARREEDQHFLEKWRPYVLRINGSASVMLELERPAHDRALELVRDVITKIENLEELDDETFRFERERSLTALKELETQIRKHRPLSELERLEDELRRAIETQEFEQAARLRDRLKVLRQVC